MRGKTVVVTGGTSGIGEVAARQLARDGARIVLVARDPVRAEETLTKLRADNPDAKHTIYHADLSSIADMKRVASEIAAAEPRIEVLVNNAGAVFLSRNESVDGLEMTFATNHLAYFVITNILLKALKAAGSGRIVSTASGAHSAGKFDFDDLQLKKGYSVVRAYGTSKLANILFTRELGRRLEGTGVTANCLHPGFVGTRFGQNNAKGWFLKSIARFAMSFGISPEDGAKTIIYLASSPDVEGKTGGYYYKCKLTAPAANAQSDADAKRLWDVSRDLAGVGDGERTKEGPDPRVQGAEGRNGNLRRAVRPPGLGRSVKEPGQTTEQRLVSAQDERAHEQGDAGDLERKG